MKDSGVSLVCPLWLSFDVLLIVIKLRKNAPVRKLKEEVFGNDSKNFTALGEGWLRVRRQR